MACCKKTYVVPAMPLRCNIWRNGVSTDDPPSNADVRCNKSLGQRNAGSFLECGKPFGLGGMWLLVPYGTPLYGCESVNCSDTVECPAGSGSFYIVRWADNAAEGFANQYRFGHMQAVSRCETCCTDDGDGPPDDPLTTGEDPWDTVFNEQSIEEFGSEFGGEWETANAGWCIAICHFIGTYHATPLFYLNGDPHMHLAGYREWHDPDGGWYGSIHAYFVECPTPGTQVFNFDSSDVEGAWFIQAKVRFLATGPMSLNNTSTGDAGSPDPAALSLGFDIKQDMHNFSYWGLRGGALDGLENALWINDTPDLFFLYGGHYFGLGDGYITPSDDVNGYATGLVGGHETFWAMSAFNLSEP